MELRHVVGRNIRSAREAAGLAQDALAHEADIHPTYLSGVETGKRNITLNVLERIARALKIDEVQLVTRGQSSQEK